MRDDTSTANPKEPAQDGTVPRERRRTEAALAVGRESPASRLSSKRTGPTIETLGQLLHWSYANLGGAMAAEQRGLGRRDPVRWMVRARLFKGLQTGSVKVGSLFADVREMPRDRCAYCAATSPPKLHADHLIPKHRGGPESADNLVWACRSCNSSKHSSDLLAWYASRGSIPPFLLIRRYLKLTMAEAEARGLMDVPLTDKPAVTFSIEYIPTTYLFVGDQQAPKKWTAT